MSRLSEMIKELCPDGVEYKKLGEVCEILDSQRKPVTKKDRTTGQYPYYGANGIKDYVDEFIFEGTFLLVGEDGSVVTEHGCPVVHWATGKIWVNNHAHILKEKEGLRLRFLFHYLQTVNIQHLVKGVPPKLNQKKLREILTPVPPLPIQNEIVKLLDNFIELTAELTAELTVELLLRKKQYNFYRDSLLNFVRVDDTIVQTDRQTDLRIGKIWRLKQSVEVKWKTLGEVCDLIAGGDVPKGEFSQVVTEEYRIPIYSNGIGEKALYGFTKSPRITQPCVTISARGTIGYSALHLTPFYPVVRLIAAIPYKCLDVKYLFYMLQMTTFKIPQTGIPQLTIPMVKTYSIPIPPLEVQQKIVSILDRFDALCNDLSQGLPAEIAARKKQYEYYRDKLLTFRRKGA